MENEVTVTYEMTKEVMSKNGGMTMGAADTLKITLERGWRKALVGRKFPALVWARAKELKDVPASEYKRLRREGGLDGPILGDCRKIEKRSREPRVWSNQEPQDSNIKKLLHLLYDAMINGDPVRFESVLATDIRAALGISEQPKIDESDTSVPWK